MTLFSARFSKIHIIQYFPFRGEQNHKKKNTLFYIVLRYISIFLKTISQSNKKIDKKYCVFFDIELVFLTQKV